jgi:hypothetical protein
VQRGHAIRGDHIRVCTIFEQRCHNIRLPRMCSGVERGETVLVTDHDVHASSSCAKSSVHYGALLLLPPLLPALLPPLPPLATSAAAPAGGVCCRSVVLLTFPHQGAGINHSTAGSRPPGKALWEGMEIFSRWRPLRRCPQDNKMHQ